MTATIAKRLLAAFLTETLGVSFEKLTAKTVGFQDLARTDCVFVTVHGFRDWAMWPEVKAFARNNGFRVRD